MKILKRIVLLIVALLIAVIFGNYPKLNIIAGYAAKNVSSSVFLAHRSLAFTDATDNNFSPVNLATNHINQTEKFATSSVFGLLTRKAIYREGLGAVVITKDYDPSEKPATPKRSEPDNTTPFPFGNAAPKDSIFSTINYPKLTQTVQSIFNPKDKTRAVVVVYKNKIVAEKYADGFSKTSKILGWSMTKSITSTIVGILQTRGLLNIEDRAPIAAWQQDERKNITLNNLLQMNSGLAWDEDYNSISDATKMLFLEKDMSQSQVLKKQTSKPNTHWLYSSGTTNLISGIIRKQFKTNQDYLDFWYAALIDKIGMNSMVVETDLAGNFVGSSYAWATPRDWAKFGLLYLNRGNWNGEQIFDPSWVDYVSTPTPTSDGGYGGQFWLNKGGKFPDVPRNMFYADGYQGQFVFIFPDRDLVVVRMGLSHFDINGFLKGVLASLGE